MGMKQLLVISFTKNNKIKKNRNKSSPNVTKVVLYDAILVNKMPFNKCLLKIPDGNQKLYIEEGPTIQ